MDPIQNTTLHKDVGVICEPFGESGAVRLVPVFGEEPGRPFILDKDAADALAVALKVAR